ncbi:MAG: carboxypeptidase regulatory-like domain-containing protein, partial [Bacteroidetes bacterium]|nr:carboxypeptidase regulatory-like domain-containing protein [Bacteroidota bacterium]
MKFLQKTFLIIFSVIMFISMSLLAQGVTTANINGLVQDTEGESLIAANVIVVHDPSGTQYGASTSADGRFFLPNLKIGGPYTVTVSFVGYNSQVRKNIHLKIGQKLNLNFILESKSVKLGDVVVVGKKQEIINSGRTGAETFIDHASVQEMPSIKRSTRDLTRLDPRSDGNFSFGGKNWLFNN